MERQLRRSNLSLERHNRGSVSGSLRHMSVPLMAASGGVNSDDEIPRINAGRTIFKCRSLQLIPLRQGVLQEAPNNSG
jgi:hypothetical protein